MKIFLLTAAGFILLGFGMIGLFIPVWPTTPFVIAAVACLGAMPRIQAIILSIPFFRDYMEGYCEKRPISSKTVVSSLVFLWGMLILSMVILKKLWLTILLLLIGTAVTTHILYMSQYKGKAPGNRGGSKNGVDKPRWYFELVFDLLYLVFALTFGIIILRKAVSPAQILAGISALVLVLGDSFHLVPRMGAIVTGDAGRFARALGCGKLVTSITMTVVYVFLWHMGSALFHAISMPGWTVAVYALAAVRIALCLLPQNGWTQPEPPVKWGIWRNLPFVVLGLMVGIFFFLNRRIVDAAQFMWLAIALSFLFYIPVFLWTHKYPALGILMLPKSCMYLWILWMCTSI